MVEVDLDVAGGERADRERGQERPDPTAAATPIPWKMSKARCTVLYRDQA